MYKKIYCFLNRNKSNAVKNGLLLNVLAGGIDAVKPILFMVIISHITNINDVGIMTISLAVGNLLVNIGKYGMRNYQVTDTNKNANFVNFLASRFITVLIMILTSIVYILCGIAFNNYSGYKAIIMLSICLLYASEAMEDVVAGRYQKNNRLDVSSRLFIYRWILTFCSFFLVFLITKNLLIASITLAIFSCTCVFLGLAATLKEGDIGGFKFDLKSVFILLSDCLPFCLANVLAFYLTNSPKFAIDIFLDDQMQAIYGYISLPVFAIGLMSSFIYQPILVWLTEMWTSAKYKAIVFNMMKQMMYIALLTIICLLFMFLFGIPILSGIFNLNLEAYKFEMLCCTFTGAFIAAASYFTILLTIMRKKILLLGAYAIAALFSLIFIGNIVKHYSLYGTSIFFLSTILLLVILLATFCIYSILRDKRIRNS